MQLGSDWGDLFVSPHSRDLASGTRTLPIALYLERLCEAERQAFLDLLDQAQRSPDAQSAVRAQLEASRIAFRYAFIIESYCQRARRLFREAQLSLPAARDLNALISRLSVFDAAALSPRDSQAA